MNRKSALSILGLGALGGCGPLHARISSMIHHCPASQAPPRPRFAISRRDVTMTTPHVRGGVAVSFLRTPAAATRAERVLYALPARGGTAADLASFLSPYLAQFLGSIVLVCVDGGTSYWHERTSGENRLAALLDDVIPLTQREVHNDARAGIIGWSMGGYGAINAAEWQPQQFDTLCAVSPAIWPTRNDQASSVPDAFDSASEFQQNDVFARGERLRSTAVRITCGTNDPFYPNAIALGERLAQLGVRTSRDRVQGGCHDAASWQESLVDDLIFVVTKGRVS